VTRNKYVNGIKDRVWQNLVRNLTAIRIGARQVLVAFMTRNLSNVSKRLSIAEDFLETRKRVRRNQLALSRENIRRMRIIAKMFVLS